MHGVDIMKKVALVAGDVMQPNLGISQENTDLLCGTVEIFYHCAATIRFDESLKTAVLVNARGTKYALEFASNIKTLKVSRIEDKIQLAANTEIELFSL